MIKPLLVLSVFAAVCGRTHAQSPKSDPLAEAAVAVSVAKAKAAAQRPAVPVPKQALPAPILGPKAAVPPTPLKPRAVTPYAAVLRRVENGETVVISVNVQGPANAVPADQIPGQGDGVFTCYPGPDGPLFVRHLTAAEMVKAPVAVVRGGNRVGAPGFGEHAHTCHACGTIFSHGAGATSHACPTCGAQETVVSGFGGPAPVVRQAAYTVRSAASGGCPNGQCPYPR